MGNYKFRLSDMIPNAWFYKLRDMSTTTRKRNTSHPVHNKKHLSTTTKSQKPNLSTDQNYYYNYTTEPKFHNSPKNPKFSDTHFPDPPRKSSKKRSNRKTIYKPSSRLVTSSVSADCACRATLNSVWSKPEPGSTRARDYFHSPKNTSPENDFHCGSPIAEFEYDNTRIDDLWLSSCSCRVSSSTTDIIIDMNEKSYTKKYDMIDGFDSISELDLPPIITKPPNSRISSKFEERETRESLSIKIVKEDITKGQKETKKSPIRKKTVSHSPGVKIRANSRLGNNKIQSHGRKSVSLSTKNSKSRRKTYSESFAIVKSSFDPQKDFRDSMMEMIVENNIKASKDLEELLACYLSLNADEYHDLIVKAFEQIWFDIKDIQI